MGGIMGNWVCSGLFVALFLIPLKESFAVDPGCEEMLREVVVLGGEVRVEGVEAISKARSQELLEYTRGTSVQSLLKAEGAFGYAAVRDEQIVGFSVFQRRGTFALISAIAVAQDWEHRDIGRDLVDRMVEKAAALPGVEDIRVVLDQGDGDSIGFFEALGFERAEVLPRQFKAQTASGVLMKRVVREETAAPPMQRAEPLKQRQRVSVAVQTIAISREALLRLDPTLENAD